MHSYEETLAILSEEGYSATDVVVAMEELIDEGVTEEFIDGEIEFTDQNIDTLREGLDNDS